MAADRPVLLRPEGDITALRVLAHVEAGDQVIFAGDMTKEPWWPAAKDTVLEMLRRQADD